MTNSTKSASRREVVRASAGVLASVAAAPLILPGMSRAERHEPVEASSQNGNGFYRFKVGDFWATVISDGYHDAPIAPNYAPNASAEELADVLKANFMQPVLQSTSNALVVDTGRERILIDSGWGEKLGHAFGDFAQLGSNLRRAGIGLESIDLVVISHGHLDHIGGLISGSGTIAFPKATFVFVDAEWNYWTGSRCESDVMSSSMPAAIKKGMLTAARDTLPVVAARSRFLKPGGEIVPGVYYVPAPGHSPSHAAILFSSGNEQFMFMADVAHNPVTGLQHPEWTPIFDFDPVLAIKTRKAILDRAATERLTVMGYHFPFPSVGHVAEYKTAFRWEPIQWVW
jgi:glyoxylase-like metal-dependent hydrolase (beta-lactamase superfamily II)